MKDPSLTGAVLDNAADGRHLVFVVTIQSSTQANHAPVAVAHVRQSSVRQNRISMAFEMAFRRLSLPGQQTDNGSR